MTSELSAAVAAFAARGGHPVRDALALGSTPFAEWEHYPAGGAEDPGTGYSWYYHSHAHDDAMLAGSHGHFHLYCAPRLFDDAAPIDTPEPASEEYRDGVCHLVGISMTMQGRPHALIALNRIGGGQWIFPAAAMQAVVAGFALGGDSACSDVGRWLGAYVRSRITDVMLLLAQRDRALGASRRRPSADGRYPPVLVCRNVIGSGIA